MQKLILNMYKKENMTIDRERSRDLEMSKWDDSGKNPGG
jgi:hypothetical protein